MSRIKYGNRVAISIQGINKPYLRYAKRDIAIIPMGPTSQSTNGWSLAARRESREDETQVALFNTVEKGFLIYTERGVTRSI